jgi:hypothetical protein
LKIYPEKLNWNMLSSNYNAINLLEKYPNKINWFLFLKEKNIFDLNDD